MFAVAGRETVSNQSKQQRQGCQHNHQTDPELEVRSRIDKGLNEPAQEVTAHLNCQALDDTDKKQLVFRHCWPPKTSDSAAATLSPTCSDECVAPATAAL